METLFLALRVLVALGAILALIWFVQRKVTGGGKKQAGGAKALAGRFGTSRKSIQVLGTHRLGVKASITVVEIDGVKMVLGVTEHGISVLENAPVPQVVAPAAAPTASPEAIAPESDPTQVAASAVDTLATADVRDDPRPVDFAAALREALDEAAVLPAAPAAAEAAPADQLASRRGRRAIPALAEQFLPHMTRTLAAGIGIRMEPKPAPVAEPVVAATAPTSGALAAFLANCAPADAAPAAEDTAPAKDYATAQPLSAHLRVLQRAS